MCSYKYICVHWGLSYNQHEWLKDYIVGNSVLREDAKKRKVAFSANLNKIKNNSVFGKQMENVRNRVDIVSINLKEKLNISNDHVEKLICDLTDKKHYIIHYKNLQIYLQLGMKLKCVHRVLSYNQHEWLKYYIVGNSVLRADANKRKDAFSAILYKIKKFRV